MPKKWNKVSEYSPRPGFLTEVYFNGNDVYAYLTWHEAFHHYSVSVKAGNSWIGATRASTVKGGLRAATMLIRTVKELNSKYASRMEGAREK